MSHVDAQVTSVAVPEDVVREQALGSLRRALAAVEAGEPCAVVIIPLYPDAPQPLIVSYVQAETLGMRRTLTSILASCCRSTADTLDAIAQGRKSSPVATKQPRRAVVVCATREEYAAWVKRNPEFIGGAEWVPTEAQAWGKNPPMYELVLLPGHEKLPKWDSMRETFKLMGFTDPLLEAPHG